MSNKNQAEKTSADIDYRLGLDIGIASIGWAVLETDDAGEPFRIADLGVRTFDAAENPKNGASLALPRRTARGARRRIRRRTHRLERAKKLFSRFYQSSLSGDVYLLRAIALDERISEADFVRILLHIVKRRGFKSNRRSEASGKKSESGAVLAATRQNAEYLAEKGYRTIGEMLARDGRFVREYNKDGTERRNYTVRNSGDCYENCFLRSDYENEVKELFSCQRKFGNKAANEEFEHKYLDIFNSQRNFDEGPAMPSKYRVSFNVGRCEFEKDEKRASRGSHTFEYFRLLQSLNNLSIKCDGEKRKLDEDERKQLLAFAVSKKEVSYSQVRKLLKLGQNQFFNLLSYAGNKNAEEIEGKSKFSSMKNSFEIRSKLAPQNDSPDIIDAAAEIIAYYKSDSRRLDEIKKNPLLGSLSENEINGILDLSFEKFGNCSYMAMKKIIPFLERGYVYSEACAGAGYDHSKKTYGRSLLIKADDEDIRRELDSIGVPLVRRAVSQVIKISNEIIRKYGSPIAINIELAREMSRPFAERKKMEKNMNNNRAQNDRIKQRISEEFRIVPKPLDIVKYKLYEQQGGKCAYTQKAFDMTRLFEPNYAQIDHVIPFSRSFDDSYNNKVLVFSEENQNKGNKTPYEYFGDNADRWNDYSNFVQAYFFAGSKSNIVKGEQLLRKSFTSADSRDWKERSLNDTKYISRFVYNLLNNYLLFKDSKNAPKQKVVAVSGKITSIVRKNWGIEKLREEGDKHHCIDACVIAAITSGTINNLTRYYKRMEMEYQKGRSAGGAYIDADGVIIPRDEFMRYPLRVPQPGGRRKGCEFRNEIELRVLNNPLAAADRYFNMGYTSEDIRSIRPVFVSRMPVRKMHGELHKATILSTKSKNQDEVLAKVDIRELKLDKDGEIDKYYNKDSDTLLYEKLKSRLAEYGGDGAKAFAEPFYKPRSNGEPGNIVKKVKLYYSADRDKGFVFESIKGYADNGSIVRTDIFTKCGKYYAVPAYTKDFYKGELPDRAIAAGKPCKSWPVMDDSYKFLFSLFPNDLIEIEHSSGLPFTKKSDGSKVPLAKAKVYFKGIDSSNASISAIDHDNSHSVRFGITTLKSMTKYTVDLLGNTHPVKSEKRLSLEHKKSRA